jgi:uncharacterized membrane protein YqhA
MKTKNNFIDNLKKKYPNLETLLKRIDMKKFQSYIHKALIVLVGIVILYQFGKVALTSQNSLVTIVVLIVSFVLVGKLYGIYKNAPKK